MMFSCGTKPTSSRSFEAETRCSAYKGLKIAVFALTFLHVKEIVRLIFQIQFHVLDTNRLIGTYSDWQPTVNEYLAFLAAKVSFAQQCSHKRCLPTTAGPRCVQWRERDQSNTVQA